MVDALIIKTLTEFTVHVMLAGQEGHVGLVSYYNLYSIFTALINKI